MISKSRLTQLARSLRRNQTRAELELWWAMRSSQIDGAKFKRQFPIGPYVVDFICHEARLVVEVDGGQHALMEREDVIRTEYLKQKGLSVVRFTNLEVLKNLEGVVSVIIESLAARARHSPSPKPSP
ncbi:MAG: endonuclease domain-containing protein [Chloroflexi bacterium]|nr:endonuclease domain-containing protein [Chloroflexota bacterium]MCI0837023.1 endonuclease domain-containing protein [Chloroflexota bacterium]